MKLIKIDTNGDNAFKYKQNIELFNIIVPLISFLITEENNVYSTEDIDWEKTKPYFNEDQNGHCIF